MEEFTRAEIETMIKEEVHRQLKEQRHTDEMPAINVNVASQDVLNRLDSLEYTLAQELKTVSETWLETMQGNYGEHKADFLQLKESQADFRDALRNTATKDDISTIGVRLDRMEATQEQILALLQQKPGS